jgi:hypothetical protein
VLPVWSFGRSFNHHDFVPRPRPLNFTILSPLRTSSASSDPPTTCIFDPHAAAPATDPVSMGEPSKSSGNMKAAEGAIRENLGSLLGNNDQQAKGVS